MGNIFQSLNPKGVFSHLSLLAALPKIGFFALLVTVAVISFLVGRTTTGGTGTAEPKTDVALPLSAQNINKEFSFPIKDENGKEISKVKYTIESVDKRNEIVVRGQKATAIKGRTFLILNIKLSNEFDKPVRINSRDYIRLTSQKHTDQIAPDIHNDPVEIQAKSTKETRLGFPLDETDKNIKIYVGEINGEKTTIDITI